MSTYNSPITNFNMLQEETMSIVQNLIAKGIKLHREHDMVYIAINLILIFCFITGCLIGLYHYLFKHTDKIPANAIKFLIVSGCLLGLSLTFYSKYNLIDEIKKSSISQTLYMPKHTLTKEDTIDELLSHLILTNVDADTLTDLILKRLQ